MTVPQVPLTVRRKVRVVGGVTTSEPLGTATLVTVPEVKSVIVALVEFELVYESVVDCPTFIVVADAV